MKFIQNSLRRSFSRYPFAFFSFALILIIAAMQQSCQQNNSESKKQIALSSEKNEFIGPEACQSCHTKEYAEWKKSDHFKAMMPANDSTVSGNFNDAELNSDGVTSKFFKRDGKYFINTDGDDGKNHDYEVKYTFGYYPLQQYLVEFPGGRMQVPRVSYNVVKKEWFNQYKDQQIHHRDWLHWTHQSQNWNSMCATCHSTGLKRNFNEETDSYHTTYSNLTVSCESCHGMGKNHAEYIKTEDYQNGNKVKGSYLVLNKGQKNTEELSACIQCHARRTELSAHVIPSTEALDNFIPTVPTTENYFPDGQFRDENYEFGSFTQSKMFHQGVKCSNCHNPHTGKIAFEGNKMCLQCHQPRYDSPQHYFHAENTEASQCVNCHMQSRTYMGADVRRDHSFRIPRPDQSVKYKTPNACTQCHTGKKDQWAADAIVKWYGPERKHNYTDELLPGSLLDQNSFVHLNKLLRDTSVTATIRATAINYLGQIASEESMNAIKDFLHDSSAIVRNEAVSSFSNFPPERWVSNVTPLLNDPVRAVRVSAANALSGVSQTEFDPNQITSFASAHSELMEFLHLQSDFAVGSVGLGDYYYKTGDNQNAEKYYLRSLKIDSLANYGRINLSSIYNSQGQNDKALASLNEAIKIDPANPRLSYNLALLYVELGKNDKALKYFDDTEKLKFDYDKFYYNYGLFLQQVGNNKKADVVFSEGLKRYPYSEQLNYGAAYFYLKLNKKESAIECIRKLKQINPTEQRYSELFALIKS